MCRSLIFFHPSLLLFNFHVLVVLVVMACVPSSPSTSVPSSSQVHSCPPPIKLNWFKLCCLLQDHERCIDWCKEHNPLASAVKCPRPGCCKALSWTKRCKLRDGFEWRYLKGNCNGMASMRQNSWFSGSKLSIQKILALTYASAHKYTVDQAVHETSLDDETTSLETVIDRY